MYVNMLFNTIFTECETYLPIGIDCSEITSTPFTLTISTTTMSEQPSTNQTTTVEPPSGKSIISKIL